MSLYRSCRNKTLSYQRFLKAAFFNRLSFTGCKSFWSLLNKLKMKPIIPNFTHNSLSISTLTSKANFLSDFFCRCFNSSTPPLSNANIPLSPISSICPPDLLCSPTDIQHLISQLPSRTSSGPDGISATMLKNTALSISEPFTMIFNSSIMSGTFPDEWKTSNIVPIPKKSSPFSPSDFRPISLLPLTNKILERHLFNWLQRFCDANNILSSCQFGFRPHFSTESALLTTTNLWFSLFNSRSSICTIFFDLQKVFDSGPHEPLLDILSKYKLPSHITRWFRSYLTCRSQYVVVDGSVSSKRMVTSGVPQGSILSPLLFILYLNDISTLPFPSSISLTLYADDILLSYPFQSSFDFSLPQGNIDLLSSWLKSRYLTINISKTKYMIISVKPLLSYLFLLYLTILLLNVF